MAEPDSKKGVQLHPDDLVFQVKPRILGLLGDQLIRDATLAVFELVKNAYDADANECTVTLEDALDPRKSRITVKDNGSGMTRETIQDSWMVIATDFRTSQRARNERSPRYNRYALGEKGLGRFSIHKLGHEIRMTTRTDGGPEYVLQIQWDELESSSDLRLSPIRLITREPEVFKGKKHGTLMEIWKLREVWERGSVRRLHRAVNSLCSPFDAPDDFKVELKVPGNEELLKGLLQAEKIPTYALYHVKGHFEGHRLEFDYKFTPPVGLQPLLTPSKKAKHFSGNLQRKELKGKRKQVTFDLSQHEIGRVEFEFWLFDRDPAVLRASTDDIKGLKDYLDENGGVRIYRDGIRVYDFGEPGNDWLNLDIRRVNTPTARTSNNQIIGALWLSAEDSGDLREKSNREGFIESPAFNDFKDAVISVLTNVEAEKTRDQQHVREAVGKGTGGRVFTHLNELRDTLAQKGMLEELDPQLKKVEREMELYRDQLLHAAVPGLSMGMMLHGAEKIMEELRAAVNKGESVKHVAALVDRLYRAMRPVTNLLKDPGIGKTTATALIAEAKFSTALRLKRHGIAPIYPERPFDFPVRGSKQMLVAALTNLVDNAIHWLEVKNPDKKILYLSTTNDLSSGPAIVVGDNGPGFGSDDPQDLVLPFFTRRRDSMGLGLYIVNEVMAANQGRLVFPAKGDINLPKEVTGAVVALQFPDKP
ncbi:MAG TPA: ATP-binding protein [Flavobacteriales bacterium]